MFGSLFRDKLSEIEAQAKKSTLSPGAIEPHLVFRLPLSERATPDAVTPQLEAVGLQVVSIEPDRAVVAFRDDQELAEFRDAIQRYEAGPREGINPATGKPYKGTSLDVLEYVDAEHMRLWSAPDRIGPSLSQLIGPDAKQLSPDKLYTVEIELWSRGGSRLAKAAVEEIRAYIPDPSSQDERLLDWFLGEYMHLVKARVRGSTLERLLETPIVAEIDLPPFPVFDAAQAARVTSRSFTPPPRPDLDGPRVCILDSGIAANHPLLAANVGHEAALLPNASSSADENGHGTRVAGIAIFGSVRACYESGAFGSPVILFSARVLNDRNEFDDEKLIINQMRDAITLFRAPPHDCRVFNLSLGSKGPADVYRQSFWAEALDILAREERVLIIVSAGNNLSAYATGAPDAERMLKEYPSHLLDPEARLSDPATAALAVTVGALAEHDVIAVPHGTSADDLSRPVARRHQPSPFTRSGPGLGNAVKPDFVDFGGNLVWEGTGNQARRIARNAGVSIMSFNREHTKQLFAYDVGTSYAAPRVARTAALLWQGLRRDLGFEPHPNLVRAVLATSATLPTACIALFKARKLEPGVQLSLCGYGQVDDELALKSSDRRVTLIAQDALAVNHFRIYEVPTPDAFKQASGRKTISVALAFDPPVRRRRRDYLGIQMEFTLIRGKTPEEISAAYKKVGRDEQVESAFKPPYRVQLEPSPTKGPAKGTLQKGTFTFVREGKDYGESYYLLVRTVRRWAPEDVVSQDFAIAVTLDANEPQLYARLSARLRARTRART